MKDQKRLNRKPNRVFKSKLIHCDYKDCDFKTQSDARLATHMKRHDNPKTEAYRQLRLDLNRRCYDSTTNTYSCGQSGCLKTFTNYNAVRDHMTYIHKSRDIVCDYADCNKVFKTKHLLRLHFNNMHKTDKPFKCPHNECGKEFAYRQRLDTHLVSHTTGRPFVCDFDGCAKSYKNRLSLTTHKRIHLSEPTIKCTVEGCYERFHAHKHMHKHRQTVHSIRPYKWRPPPGYKPTCLWPGCDFTSKTNYQLNVHQRTHTGEKPYACDWPECGHRFARRSHIKDHMNAHKNVKPYACHWPGCQHRCSHRSNVNIHYKQVHQK
ncbi:unnamed protein product [Medioppia subpectinata]|uniref:C2H2-type domain-containing protein n=1 Tax=Medioppia subpectinata TaxID=1979941 RepID=A0A7R9L0U8_9ACAR|nr:unnamed protein product [Medioppia subpectinata]CAG2113403.1 unnamed protein product [Medioppia subpectinata]